MSSNFDQLLDFVQGNMADAIDRIAFENKGKEKGNLKLKSFKVVDFPNRENPETPRAVGVFHVNQKEGKSPLLWHGAFIPNEEGKWDLHTNQGSINQLTIEQLEELSEIGKLVTRFHSEVVPKTESDPKAPAPVSEPKKP